MKVFANHAHVFRKDQREDGTVDVLLETMEQTGIDRAVCFAPFYEWGLDYNPNLWLKQQLSGHPELTGFGVVDIHGVDLTHQVAQIKELGFRGIKLHPNFQKFAIDGPEAFEVYQAAQEYGLFLTFHTGVHWYRLKDAHPLLLDEVAVTFPQVRFVMCHMGNPWLQDAAAVLEKNFNVSADLSGLLVGRLPIRFYEEHESYLTLLKTWIEYVDDYSRLMYGTDWPLVNIPDYQNFISRVIPERHQQKVFFENANQIYQLGL